MRHVPGTNGKFDPARVCHACKNKGHWKGECPISKTGQTSADSSVYVKSTGLVSFAQSIDVSESGLPGENSLAKSVDELYAPFVSDRFVSLDGNDKTPVKILRDTGATESLIVGSILPFSTTTATGSKAPVVGVGLIPLLVPVHKFNLFSDLVCGEVDMGVRPKLPIQGIDIILGNDLAGKGLER